MHECFLFLYVVVICTCCFINTMAVTDIDYIVYNIIIMYYNINNYNYPLFNNYLYDYYSH